MAVIRQRGQSWQAIVRVKLDGQLHSETRSFAKERLAKEWASKLEASIKVNGIPQRVKSVMTLGELLTKYQNTVNDVKPMRKQMNWELEQLSMEFKDVKLNQLTAKLFSDFGRRRSLAGASGATVMHNLATVRGVLNAAKPVLGVDVTGDAVSDAVKALQRIGAVSKSQSRARRPTDAELDTLRGGFREQAKRPQTVIPMEAIMDLAVALPRRLGELTSMLWVDFDGAQVVLRETKNPTAPRTEIVPVPEDAAAIINGLHKIDARILPYDAESVGANWQRMCKKLKIDNLHFHDLRHEGISRLFAAGLDIPEVALISGHQSWAMLKRYTHLKPSTVLEKLNAGRKEPQKAATQPE